MWEDAPRLQETTAADVFGWWYIGVKIVADLRLHRSATIATSYARLVGLVEFPDIIRAARARGRRSPSWVLVVERLLLSVHLRLNGGYWSVTSKSAYASTRSPHLKTPTT